MVGTGGGDCTVLNLVARMVFSVVVGCWVLQFLVGLSFVFLFCSLQYCCRSFSLTNLFQVIIEKAQFIPSYNICFISLLNLS